MTSLSFLVALFFTRLQKKGNIEISVSKDVIYLRNLTNYDFLAKTDLVKEDFNSLTFFSLFVLAPSLGLFHFVVY